MEMPTTDELRVIDLALMIRRLVRRLELRAISPEDHVMIGQALALLEKHGIKSSPLR
jgi:hypothetical protein